MFSEQNIGFVAIQVINFALILAWLFLAYKAISHLYKSSFTVSTKILWTLMIFFVPILAASLYILTMQEAGLSNKR